jgi:hypothetical protein
MGGNEEESEGELTESEFKTRRAELSARERRRVLSSTTWACRQRAKERRRARKKGKVVPFLIFSGLSSAQEVIRRKRRGNMVEE